MRISYLFLLITAVVIISFFFTNPFSVYNKIETIYKKSFKNIDLENNEPRNHKLEATSGINSEGTSIGSAKKGDTFCFQYISGEWSFWPKQTPLNPDDSRHNNVNSAPPVLCYRDEKNNNVILLQLPKDTANKPYRFQCSRDYNNLFLVSMDKKPDNNQGFVIYKVWKIETFNKPSHQQTNIKPQYDVIQTFGTINEVDEGRNIVYKDSSTGAMVKVPESELHPNHNQYIQDIKDKKVPFNISYDEWQYQKDIESGKFPLNLSFGDYQRLISKAKDGKDLKIVQYNLNKAQTKNIDLKNNQPRNHKLEATSGINSEGTSIGSAKKGDVLCFQYVAGKWSFSPTQAPLNPDDIIHNNPNATPPALCYRDKRYNNRIIAELPNYTTFDTFKFECQRDYDNLFLLNMDTNPDDNQGVVIYKVWKEHKK